MRDLRADSDRTPAREAAKFLARHPRSTVTATAVTAADLYFGHQALLMAAGSVAACGGSWRVLDAPSFDHWAGRVLRAWWRRWAAYQRQWSQITHATGLITADHKGTTRMPRIVRVRSTWCWDTVVVRMTKGQTQADYENVLDRLANAYRARRATLRTLKPGTVALDFQRREPFDELFVTAPDFTADPTSVNLARLTIGRDEYGRHFALDLVNGLHILLAGATGAGKGSFEWGLIRALAPMVREGTVRLWVIDPKGGMEFGAGQAMFHRFADNPDDGLKVTREYIDTLDDRKEHLGRRGIRTHTPSVDQPLDVLICDELAAMTAYADRDLSREFEPLLSKALTQYRAVGGRIVAATQEPTKDTVPMRGLFPTRIALRLDQESYVDMTLGEGMRDKGAFADQIPEFLPGVAYVKQDGKREPLRVRAGYTSDTDIAELVAFCTDTATTEATVTPLHRHTPESAEDTAEDAAAVVGETADEDTDDIEVIEYFDGDDEPDQDIA